MGARVRRAARRVSGGMHRGARAPPHSAVALGGGRLARAGGEPRANAAAAAQGARVGGRCGVTEVPGRRRPCTAASARAPAPQRGLTLRCGQRMPAEGPPPPPVPGRHPERRAGSAFAAGGWRPWSCVGRWCATVWQRETHHGRAEQAFAPTALPMLRGSRPGATCKSGVRTTTCAMDMAGAQSMLIAAAKVAVEAAEDAEDVVEEVAKQSGPAISVVGKTIGGNILIVAPILGGLIVFSIIGYILTQTFFLPPNTTKGNASERRSD